MSEENIEIKSVAGCEDLQRWENQMLVKAKCWNQFRVIKEYQNKPEELKRIAQTGCDYVRSHFNEKAVLETFIKQFENSYNKFENSYNK